MLDMPTDELMGYTLDKLKEAGLNISDDDMTNQQFIQVMFTSLEDRKFREAVRGPLALCLYLCRYVCRSKEMYKNLDIYTDYYLKGYLAATFESRKLADKFGYKSKNSILDQVKILIRLRWVRVKQVSIGRGRNQNVYVLGEMKNGKPVWYFNSPGQ